VEALAKQIMAELISRFGKIRLEHVDRDLAWHDIYDALVLEDPED